MLLKVQNRGISSPTRNDLYPPNKFSKKSYKQVYDLTKIFIIFIIYIYVYYSCNVI